MERQLIAIITTTRRSFVFNELAASSFYFCSQTFIDLFQADEKKSIRRLKEKIAEEQKRICQTNQGNHSAFDGDLGLMEVKMSQNI